jgi:clan AA aspartic protease
MYHPEPRGHSTALIVELDLLYRKSVLMVRPPCNVGWQNRLGYVKVTADISDPVRTQTKRLEFLVDTGASYMVIPTTIAEELGLKPVKKTRVTLADKREVEAGYAFVYISLLGREAPVTTLVFDSPMPLLGTFTLQVLGLEVDPSKEEIRPSRPFALGLMNLIAG